MSSGTECIFNRLLFLRKLDDLYSTLNVLMTKLQKIKLARHIASMGRRSYVNRCLVKKYEGYRQLGRPNLRYEDNTKKDLHKLRWGRL
jgi:hypothetical protein